MAISTEFINGMEYHDYYHDMKYLNDDIDDCYDYNIEKDTYEYNYKKAKMVSDTRPAPKQNKSKYAKSVGRYDEAIERIRTKQRGHDSFWDQHFREKMRSIASETMKEKEDARVLAQTPLKVRTPHPATKSIREYLSARPKDLPAVISKSTTQDPTLLQLTAGRIRKMFKFKSFTPRKTLRGVLSSLLNMPIFWGIWTVMTLAISLGLAVVGAAGASMGSRVLTWDTFFAAIPTAAKVIVGGIMLGPVYAVVALFTIIIIMDIVVAAWEFARG